MNADSILSQISAVSEAWAADRRNRQPRRHLERADFDRLAAAGYLLSGVPASMGGLWTDIAASTRPIVEILRVLAKGDPSVALVSAMHPAVLSFWLAQPQAPEPYTAAWAEQSRGVAQSALDGAWWGTITSEPGSGGDVARTRTRRSASPTAATALTGQKHFGSGSGIILLHGYDCHARRANRSADWFFMDVPRRAVGRHRRASSSSPSGTATA